MLLEPPGGRQPEDGISLRRWFVFYCLWMAVLAWIVWWGQTGATPTDSVRFHVALLGCYAFYMSLCCTFFPAPTSWIVMLLASNWLHIVDPPVWRLVTVAGVGAIGTCMANLNEYHIFTFILRYGKVARVRRTHMYGVAARWFAVSPFSVIILISFIPIPVDVIRWLAITYRYPRIRYFEGYFIGRFCRYSLWAATTIWFNLTLWHIVLIQAVLVVAALAKILVAAWKSHEGKSRHAASTEAGEVNAAKAIAEPATMPIRQ